MSHASATHVTRSARITEAVPARPLLVVEHLDHSAGSTVLFTYCAQNAPAETAQFTYCAQSAPAETAQFTYCAQSAPAETAQFTYCAQTAPSGAFGAESAAPVAVEGDAVVGSWI